MGNKKNRKTDGADTSDANNYVSFSKEDYEGVNREWEELERSYRASEEFIGDLYVILKNELGREEFERLVTDATLLHYSRHIESGGNLRQQGIPEFNHGIQPAGDVLAAAPDASEDQDSGPERLPFIDGGPRVGGRRNPIVMWA